MKSLIAAVALLVLATPAFASPRHPTPAQLRDIRAWETGNEACYYSIKPEKVKKGCAAADRLRKKLEPQGFCFYGHGTVGRRGKKYWYPGFDAEGTNAHWARHCYTLSKRPR